MNNIEKYKDKLKGALYGFTIGDAMGATTEFMTEEQIKEEHGQVTEIIGGGWLELEPGEVTDDTQMTLCIIKAVLQQKDKKDIHADTFIKDVKANFIKWYRSKPKDIGAQVRLGIIDLLDNRQIRVMRDALGNGSLMRALPLALMGNTSIRYNVSQGRLTHNNETCDDVILNYHLLINDLLNVSDNNQNPFNKLLDVDKLVDPTGHVLNTFNNALYWSRKETFEECIIGAVNHGGDSDTIAAIAGSISGITNGYSSIPQKWVDVLPEDVKVTFHHYVNYLLKFYEKS